MDPLTSQYISGYPVAIEELYRRHSPGLLLTAYGYCRNKEVAEDVVQDIFEKLIQMDLKERQARFSAETDNLEAWMHVSVKNRAMDKVKVQDNREKIMQSIRSRDATLVSNGCDDAFMRDGVRNILDRLQPRQKQILSLHMEGYRNEEIAERLQLTYNTVKNNIYEARLRIVRMWHHFLE